MVIQIPQKDIVKGSSDDAGAVLTVCILGKALCSLSVSAQSDMALGKTLNQFSATEAALLPAPLLWPLWYYGHMDACQIGIFQEINFRIIEI